MKKVNKFLAVVLSFVFVFNMALPCMQVFAAALTDDIEVLYYSGYDSSIHAIDSNSVITVSFKAKGSVPMVNTLQYVWKKDGVVINQNYQERLEENMTFQTVEIPAILPATATVINPAQLQVGSRYTLTVAGLYYDDSTTPSTLVSYNKKTITFDFVANGSATPLSNTDSTAELNSYTNNFVQGENTSIPIKVQDADGIANVKYYWDNDSVSPINISKNGETTPLDLNVNLPQTFTDSSNIATKKLNVEITDSQYAKKTIVLEAYVWKNNDAVVKKDATVIVSGTTHESPTIKVTTQNDKALTYVKLTKSGVSKTISGINDIGKVDSTETVSDVTYKLKATGLANKDRSVELVINSEGTYTLETKVVASSGATDSIKIVEFKVTKAAVTPGGGGGGGGGGAGQVEEPVKANIDLSILTSNDTNETNRLSQFQLLKNTFESYLETYAKADSTKQKELYSKLNELNEKMILAFNKLSIEYNKASVNTLIIQNTENYGKLLKLISDDMNRERLELQYINNFSKMISKVTADEIKPNDISALNRLSAVNTKFTEVDDVLNNSGISFNLVKEYTIDTPNEDIQIASKVINDLITAKVSKLRIVTPNGTIVLKLDSNFKTIGEKYSIKLEINSNGEFVLVNKTGYKATLEIPFTGDVKSKVLLNNKNVGGKVVDGNIVFDTNLEGTFKVDTTVKTFGDVNSHWGKQYIEMMASKGIINGMSEDNFDPNGNLTRAQFAKLLVSLMQLEKQSDKQMKDVASNAWYYDSIVAAVENGLMTGYEDGSFMPDKNITRQEMATIISRVLKLNSNVKKDISLDTYLKFADNDSIANYAKEPIALAFKYGIVSGRQDGSFDPTNTATRAEAAKIIAMIYGM